MKGKSRRVVVPKRILRIDVVVIKVHIIFNSLACLRLLMTLCLYSFSRQFTVVMGSGVNIRLVQSRVVEE